MLYVITVFQQLQKAYVKAFVELYVFTVGFKILRPLIMLFILII